MDSMVYHLIILHTVEQLVRSAKNETLIWASNWGSDIDRMRWYQNVKARVCIRGLLSTILRSSCQFYEIISESWPREVLHVNKIKTVRKWELNTSDNFMSLMRRVFSLGLCGMMASSSAIVLRIMVRKVNENMCVCWGGC